MFLAMPLAAMGLALLATPVSAPLSTPRAVSHAARADAHGLAPLVGRWSLDVSRIPEAERPRRVAITFRVTDDGRLATRVEIVAPDGSTSRAESVATLDGIPVPVTGTIAAIDTVGLRQPEPNTLVMTLGKGGTPVSTRVYTVAEDHRSMTETIVWAHGEMPRLETTYFQREE